MARHPVPRAKPASHLPRPIIQSLETGGLNLQVIAVEPPALKLSQFGDLIGVADQSNYRPLLPLLWALALSASHVQLLRDIDGHSAYRLAASFTAPSDTPAGALGVALKRLRLQVASLKDIPRWQGMDMGRATRLLNGVYLQGGLMVLRTHHAARASIGRVERLRDWFQPACQP